MKKEDLSQKQKDVMLDMQCAGHITAIGEWRGAVCSVFEEKDEDNPLVVNRSFSVRHAFEFADSEQQQVMEYLDEKNTKFKDGVPECWVEGQAPKNTPFKKGMTVLLDLDSYKWTKGGRKCSGHFLILAP